MGLTPSGRVFQCGGGAGSGGESTGRLAAAMTIVRFERTAALKGTD